MIDKKELVSTYLQQFGSHYQMSRLLNPTLRIDDEFISRFFEQIVDQYGEAFAVTEEEKAEIERKIKSQYCIFQDEGAALVGDYEHDFLWYANLQAQDDYDEYYWPRYKAHLENKNFSPAGIDTLEKKTLPKLMSYIGNPNEDSPFSIRGLVVGDVQSGKTSNYLGLITKAADAGYKVIFLLILDAKVFGKIKYRVCGRHFNPIAYSKHFKCYELIMADIVEFLPTEDQEKLLTQMLDQTSTNYKWATEDQISSCGVDSSRSEYVETITEHSYKILDTVTQTLVLTKETDKVYEVKVSKK